ncbi:MAG: hypothetical protein GXP45_01995 [bacterium]|nr:hypothetical protein [bacterium]
MDDLHYELPIEENKDHTIKIIVEDKNHDMYTEKTFQVKVNRDDIIGKLLITPDTV